MLETKWLSYVQLLDSALPIGGFSHSFGLESYVQDGHIQTPAQLEHYLMGQISSSLVPFEGSAILHIYRAIEREQWEQVSKFDQLLHIQRGARESREGLHKMGKRLLKLAKAVYPWMSFEALEDCFKQHGGYGSLPTVHTWLCYQLELPAEACLKGYLYSSVTTLVNSAMRLMSIGQTDGHVIIQKLLPIIELESSRIILDLQPPSSFALAQEIHAMRHETLYSRLFMS